MTNMFLDNDKYVSRSHFPAKSFSGQSFGTSLNYTFAPKLIVDLNDEGDGDDDIEVNISDDLDDGHCNDNADLDNGNFYGNDSDDDEQYLCCWRI